VRPMADGDALGMSTMVFPDEIIDPATIDEIPAADEIDVTAKEIEIAKQLIDSLAGPFQPGKYRDTYRDEVLDLIERKAQGEEIAVQPAVDEQAAPVPDLMSALKASLDAVRSRDENGAAAATKKAPARKAPAKKAAAKKAPAGKPAADKPTRSKR